jgi:hypothetical protein
VPGRRYAGPIVLLGIDHFIVVVPNPDDASAELERGIGIRAAGGGRHESYGSFNRLVWLGDSYIELLAISDPSLAERAWFGPHALRVLERSGGGYVGLALATDDVESDTRTVRERGSALGEPDAGERARPDGRMVRWRVATAAKADPELGHMFLIEHDAESAEWTQAERTDRAGQVHPLGGPVRLLRVELPVSDMQASTNRLHRDLGLAFRPSLSGGGARDTSVGRQTLRLLRAAPESLPKVILRGGSQARALTALGCHWVVEPAAD